MIANLLSELVVAQATPPPGGSPFGSIMSILPILLMVGVFYFLVIRPAGKQQKEQQAMLAALKKDDEVITGGGLVGKIVSVEDRIVTVEIADKVKVRVLRDRIAGRWQAAQAATADKK